VIHATESRMSIAIAVKKTTPVVDQKRGP